MQPSLSDPLLFKPPPFAKASVEAGAVRARWRLAPRLDLQTEEAQHVSMYVCMPCLAPLYIALPEAAPATTSATSLRLAEAW